MRRGEIWTVAPPSYPKPRPAVILSIDTWNRYAPDIVVIPLTSRPGPSRPPVRHPRLNRKSYAKCGAIAAIPKDRLGQRIGRLGDQAMAGIVVELRRLLGV